MKTMRNWFGRVGFTAVGVGVGVILAAGSGFAAVQLSRNSASDHSIDAVQATSSHVGSVDKEKSAVSGADDRAGVDDRSGTSGTDDRAGVDDRSGTSGTDDQPGAVEPEPEPNDDKSTKTAPTTSNSGRSGVDDNSAHRSPEPGDDRGHGGNH